MESQQCNPKTYDSRNITPFLSPHNGKNQMFRLNLSKHCIETELKRQYNHAISNYFKAQEGQKPFLESSIEILHQALENLNFASLRSQFPELAGGFHQPITLSRSQGDLVITTKNNVIKTPIKKF